MASFHLTSHLTLFADPVQDMHAVTKQYVDAKALNIDGSRIVSGVIAADKMPALTGDVETSAGSTVVTLKDTGVVPGTYNNVTVDSKGRAVAGTNYTPSYTDLSWNLVTGTPTTLEGYGITDVLSTVKGGIVQSVKMNAVQDTSPTALVTKATADSLVGQFSTRDINTGEIIRSSVVDTPMGYLRANGGSADKTLYASLYAIVGDSYGPASSITGVAAMGQPWRQQYAFNTANHGDITGWTTGPSLPATVHSSQAIVTKNRVYLLSGIINDDISATVYTAPIHADGTLGTWTTGTSLPGAVYESQALVTKDRVYLLGGITDGAWSSAVYTAPINTDGTLDPWTTGTSLPESVYASQAIVTKDRVYLLGGYSDTGPSSTVYTAPINADGTLGSWTTGTSLPGTVAYSQAIVTKNRVYLLGVYANGWSPTVYTAPINADGTLGVWTTATSLPGTVYASQAVVTKNRVYLLGGIVNSATSSTVYTAPINADGTLGTWTTAPSLPGTITDSQAIVTNNRVYLLGGYINDTNSSTVYTAPFSGGYNIYTADIVTTDTSKFKLPDYSPKETDLIYYYIKY